MKNFRIIIFAIILTISNCAYAKLLIFVIGPPGAGKTYMLEESYKKHGWKYSSLGEILRQEVKKNTELGRTIKPFLDKGEMAPLSYIKELMIRELNKDDNLIIMDGFPRGEEYYNLLSEVSGDKYFVVVRAPIVELRKRLLSRGRHDDNIAVIEKRLSIYQSDMLPFENRLLKMENSIEIKTDKERSLYLSEFYTFVSSVINNSKAGAKL